MEFFDEVVLSLITVVFALLIVKITSAASAGRSSDRSRSIEVRGDEEEEEEKRKVERSEVVDLVKELDEKVKIGEEDDDELVEFELQEEGKREEMRSRAFDLVIEESANKLDEAVKIGDDDSELVKLDLQEEKRKEERAQVLDSGIEEFVKKLDETVKIGEDDDCLIKFDLPEEKKGGEMRFQEVDLVIEESVKEFDELVRVGHVDAKLVIYDLQEEANSEEKKSQIVDLVVEDSAKQFHRPATIDENDAELVKFDFQEEDNREEKKSQFIDLVMEESVKEFYELIKIREDPKLVKFDLPQEEKRSQPINLTIGESVKELKETVKIVEDEAGSVIFDLQEDKYIEELVKELHEPVKIGEDDLESLEEKEKLPEMRSSIHEDLQKSEIGIGEESSINEKEGTLLYGEDEWEGIEKSELDKLFGVAVEYASSEDGGNELSKVSSDVKKQLYGLHKVATEGPCYEPQPLALKVTARAKWHSWQRLGNMNPEMAMEQYIAVLSESIPGWMGEKTGGDAKQGEGNDTPDKGASRKEVPDLSSVLQVQPTSSGAQRAFEDPSRLEVDKPTSGPNLSAKGLTKTFLFDLLSPTRVTFLTVYW